MDHPVDGRSSSCLSIVGPPTNRTKRFREAADKYCKLADSHFSLVNLTTWILHLAATTMEATVNRALPLLLQAGEPFDFTQVRDLAEPEAPALAWYGKPDLRIYDGLITSHLAVAAVFGS